MNKTFIPIKGMHCRSCEIVIGDKLKEIPEVKNVSVNWKKREATIYSKHEINKTEARLKIQEAGYDVGLDESKSWISKDPSIYQELGISLLILVAIFIWAKAFGLTNFSFGSSTGSGSLIVVLLLGLTAGISSCMALVGGLVLGISAKFAEKHPVATPAEKFRPHLFFILGRTVAYFIFGGVIALLGRTFELSGLTLGMLTVFAGVVMLIIGLQLIEVFPRLSNATFSLPSGLSQRLGFKSHSRKEYSHGNSALLGALTIFLPCGFTQAVMILAIDSGSFMRGALIMGVFVLGTAPGLLGIGGLTSIVKGSFTRYFFRFTGLLVVALAIFNFNNGLNLAGLKPSFGGAAETKKVEVPAVAQKDGVQTVNMTQSTYGYTPDTITIEKDMPVRWVIKSLDSNTCAASLFSSKLKVRKLLEPGENIIEFTPTERGVINFSCSMGMYTGKFIVK